MYVGHSFRSTIESILIPIDLKEYVKAIKKIAVDHRILYNKITDSQDQIDEIVYDLYEIKKLPERAYYSSWIVCSQPPIYDMKSVQIILYHLLLYQLCLFL